MTTDKVPGAQDTTQPSVDATLTGNEPSPGSEGPAPKEAPKTHTIEDVTRAVQLARMDAGRERKVVEDERDSLKSQLESKDAEITDNAEELQKWQAKVDDLTSEDPKRFDAIKELRLAQEERRQLKADRRVLESEKQTHGAKVKLADDTLREISIFGVAAEYEGGDHVKLKDLCDTFEAKSDEQIRKVADNLWTKKPVGTPATTPATPLHPDPGVTNGGIEDTSDLSPREKIERGIDKLKKK